MDESGVINQVDLREEWNKILEEVDCEISKNHHHAHSFTPSSKVVKLVDHCDVGYDDTCAIDQMSDNPEANVFTVGELLFWLHQEQETACIYNSSVP